MTLTNPVEEIKARVPIVDLVGQRVKLSKSGRNLKGLCPFHNEKTPSFYVFPDRDNYHCFGCGQSGDAFTFVMRTENVEFTEALRILAEQAGVEIAPRGARRAEDQRRNRLVEINAAAARYFQAMLFAPPGAAALAYLEGRGVTRASIETFQLGWAPESWDALLKQLGEQGFAPEELAEVGLVLARESGGHYDRFRGRVMFPIRNPEGEVIGFGGRAMGDVQPKYLNSSDSPLFTKGASLYAIDQARSAIKREGLAVLVEGYMDALIAHQAGIQHVVAALGTALTEEHLATLKRLAPRVVLALDADAAGDAAALRTLEVIRATYGKVATPVADRRGLVRLRYDQELDVRVARLPEGQDPDEVIRESPERFLALVAEARPIVEVLIEAEVGRAGADVQARALAADNVLDFLKDLPNQVLADQYGRMLAERLGVDPDVVRGRLAELRRAGRAAARRQRPAPAAEPDPVEAGLRDWLTLEEFLLHLALRHPGPARAAMVDVSPEDFYRADARAVFELVEPRLDGLDPDRPEALLAEIDGPLGEYLVWIARWGDDLPSVDEARAAAELELLKLRLRLLNHRREIALIALRRREGDREGDHEDWARQSARVAELAAQIRALERSDSRRIGGFAPNWAGMIAAEGGVGPMGTVARPRPTPAPAAEEGVAAAS